MVATIIDGKKIAQDLRSRISDDVSDLKKRYRVTPTLAVILVGNDPASEIYVRNKEKAAHSIGMNSIQFRMDQDISTDELIGKIQELNKDNSVAGILLQLPLPKHIDATKAISSIDFRKDVDGFHITNVGKLSSGLITGKDAAIVPCTPLGSVHLIKEAMGQNIAGAKALVIGSSNIVGRPLAQLLNIEKCTVTVAHRETRDLKGECLRSDIIATATGRPNLVTADMVKPGAVVIDIGITRVDDLKGGTKIVGDVDFEAVKNVASAITPVPGGVGPMTIAYLLKNTISCFIRQHEE